MRTINTKFSTEKTKFSNSTWILLTLAFIITVANSTDDGLPELLKKDFVSVISSTQKKKLLNTMLDDWMKF